MLKLKIKIENVNLKPEQNKQKDPFINLKYTHLFIYFQIEVEITLLWFLRFKIEIIVGFSFFWLVSWFEWETNEFKLKNPRIRQK